MKSQKWYIRFLYLIIFMLTIMLAGCSFIGGVFKTGIGVGAFLVIALVAVIFYIARRRNTP